MNTNLPADTEEFLVPGPSEAGGPQAKPVSVQVDLGGLSHPGKVRPNNEDHYLVVRGGRFLQTLLTNLPDGSVPQEFGDTIHAMVVADGMGGMAAGEVASRLAITFFVGLLLDTPDWIFSSDEPRVEAILARVARRFHDVNTALVEQGQRDPQLTGMGTTLTLAWSFRTDLFIAHLGDSRAYLLHGGSLHKLTRDHTLAQGLADAGVISAAEAATHRFRHVLTHALGVSEKGTKPQVHRVRLADGDRVLLCTDGLTDMVDDATIAATLGRGMPAAETCQVLVDLALQAGGKDNVTAVVCGYRIAAQA
jgi:serine/threonine protein phosphatase PrpC